MPLDIYIQFKDAQNNVVKDDNGASWFELNDYSFDVEQILNIGSQSTGTGAGRIAFNPLSIALGASRNLAATLFKNCAQGTAFKQVEIACYRAGGGGSTSAALVDDYVFSLVGVKTLSFSHDEESPRMSVALEYGGLRLSHYATDASGKANPSPATAAWNRVKNLAVADKDADTAPAATLDSAPRLG